MNCDICGNENAHVNEKTPDMCLCDECAGESFVVCQSCQTRIWSSEAKSDSANDAIFCPSCYKARHDRNEMYGLMGKKAEIVRAWTDMDSTPAIGIEIECYPRRNLDDIHQTHKKSLKCFAGKHDCSLGPGGIELVSAPIPVEKFESFVNSLDFTPEFTVDRKCGFHVHINLLPWINVRVGDMQEIGDAMKRLFVGFVRLERFFLTTQPASRRDSHFASSMESRLHPMQYCQDEDAPAVYYQDPYITCYEHLPVGRKYPVSQPSIRYNWCNLHAMQYINTLEIRLHAGTTNKKKMRMWGMAMYRLTKWIMESEYETVCNVNEDMLPEILGQDVYNFLRERQATHAHGGQ